MPKSKKQLAQEEKIGREIRTKVETDLLHRANNGTPRNKEKPNK